MGRVVISDEYPLADELLAPFLTNLQTRIETDPALMILLGGRNVYVGGDPEDKPPSGKWVVIGYESPAGEIPEHNEGWETPRLHVRSESRETLHSRIAALTFHTDIHAVIATRILNHRPTLSGGANGGTGEIVHREEKSPLVRYDADSKTYYFASFFSTRIIAAQV